MLRRPAAARRAPLLGALLLAFLAAGCVETVQGRASPELSQMSPIHRLAVLPFAVGTPLAGQPASGETSPDAAAAQLSHQVAQALQKRQVDVVAPTDVRRALLVAGLPATGDGVDPAAIGRLVHEHFGADGFLMGRVYRFQEREGRPAGATRPAAVGFQVGLYDASGGQLLWTGTVDERQKPLGANLFDASRYPGHGFRWLSVDELAAWCAGQMAQAIPLHP